MDIPRSLRRVATPGRVTAAFLVAMVYSMWFFALGPYAAMEDHGIIDERFGVDGDGVAEALDAMGDGGRDTYRVFLLGDLLFALLQGAWLTGFVAYGTRRFRLPDGLVWLPIAGMLSDWLENAALAATLAVFPDIGAWGTVASIAIHVKFAANVAAVLAAVAVVAMFIMKPVRRKR